MTKIVASKIIAAFVDFDKFIFFLFSISESLIGESSNSSSLSSK